MGPLATLLGRQSVRGSISKIGNKVGAYHGSPSAFNKFRLDKIGSATDSGMFGEGFYFAGRKKDALPYMRGPNGNIKQVDLDIRNPLVLNNSRDIPEIIVPNKTLEHMRDAPKNYSKKFRDYLIDNDYDGVVDNIRKRHSQIVALYPEQISIRPTFADYMAQLGRMR